MAIIALVIGIVAFAVISNWREEQDRPHQVAIQVGDSNYTLGYFANRLRLFVEESGGPQNAAPQLAFRQVTDILIQEEVVRQFASQLNLSVTPVELNQYIRGRLGISADTQAEAGATARQPTPDPVEVLYQLELRRTGLNDGEYRQMAAAQILIRKVRNEFLAQVPTSAPSIHYRQILVRQEAEADTLVARINSGEDFAQVARQSLDANSRVNGGDVGWVPRGALDRPLEDALFSLSIGEVKKVPFGSLVYILQVLEKASTRPLDPQYRSDIGNRAYQEWLDQMLQQVEINNHMDLQTGDIAKIEWALRRVYGG